MKSMCAILIGLLSAASPTFADDTKVHPRIRDRQTESPPVVPPPLGTVPASAPTMSREDMKSILREILQEHTADTIRPLKETVNNQQTKLTELEGKVLQIAEAHGQLGSDTGRALVEFRSELSQIRSHMRAMGQVVEALCQELERQEQRGSTLDVDAQELIRTLTEKTQKQERQMEALQKKLDDLATPPQPAAQPKTPPPTPPPSSVRWNNLRLPCGYLIGTINVPASGTEIRCPKCRQVNFLKP